MKTFWRIAFVFLFTGFSFFTKAQTVLSESFEGTFPPAGWTLFNAGTGNNWSQNTAPSFSYSGTKSLRYQYNFTYPGNAWIFSPGITLNSGTTYRISYFYRGASAIYTEKMKVSIGQGANVASQINLLHDYPSISNITFTEGIDYFIPPSTGSYNLGLNCYSPENQNQLLVDSVVIKTTTEPSVYSFVPKYGGIGETIQLTGFNFLGTTAVSFGGTPASSFTVNSNTSITAVTAAGASGSVSITTASGTASLAGFTYLNGITFSPQSGAIGTPVVVRGTGFDPVPANNTVFFGTIKATVTGGTTTSLNVTVPAGACYEQVSVNTNGARRSSAIPFIVTFPFGSGGFLPSSFQPLLDSATGSNPASISSADFDGDGKADVVTANTNDNTISVLANSSTLTNISFSSKVSFATGANPKNIAITDFDGDNKPDIIVTNYNAATVSVLRNTSLPGTISFAAKVDFTTGGNPISVATGDFDSDGKPDIAVVNYDNSNTVSVLRNTTTGSTISFAAKVDYATATTPSYVAVGDLDNDGKPEMAISSEYNYYTPNQHSLFSVYKNNSTPGNIVFAAKTDFQSQYSQKKIIIADINIDGKPDVGTISYGTGIYILRNTSTSGTISFAPKQDFGYNCYSTALADFDGDGRPDFAHEFNVPTVIGLLRNTSGGTVISAEPMAYYSTLSLNGTNTLLNVCTGDFNGDGKPDVAASNSPGSISILQNKINQPYIASFSPAGGNQGTMVTIKGVKLTGASAVSFGGVPAQSFTVVSDSVITAVVGNGGTGSISITGMYGTAIADRFVYPGIPVITSLNATTDTLGGLVSINGNNFNAVDTNNVVYFGAVRATVISASTTSLLVKVPAGINYAPVTVTTNKVTAYSPQPFTILFSGGGAALTANSFAVNTDVVLNYSSAPSPTGIVTADFDTDGKPDMATANYTISKGTSVVRNNSSKDNLAFSVIGNFSTSSYARSIAAADFDGDGKLDYVCSNETASSLAVFMNTSAGSMSFAPKKDIASLSSPVSIATGDIDGDGKPDMVVSNNGDNSFSVFKNTATQTGVISFAAPLVTSTGTSTSPGGICTSDVDGDGKADVVVVNQSANNIAVFRNTTVNGVISFAPKVNYTTGTYPFDLIAADLDKDGKMDIIVANQNSSNISVFRNTSVPGAISLATKIDFVTTGGTLYDITANDVDGDGKIDIAAASYTNAKAYIFRNTSTSGNISLETAVQYQLGNQPRAIALADVDMDGKPDILSANYVGGNISVLRNQIGEPLKTYLCPPIASTTLTSNISGANYQWQLNTGSGFVDIIDNTNYSGTATGSLQLINIPSSWYGYQYRCVVNGVNSDAFVIKFRNTWTGNAGSAWENPANWSCGTVPDSFTDVILATFSTVTLNSNTTIRSLRANYGANLTVVSGVTLTVLQ